MRTLLIEDDAHLQKLLRLGLAEEGFSVDVAADGEAGLHLARSESYDAIILDLMVPLLPGLAVLEALRGQGRDTPVLILTARDAPRDRVTGLDLGADDYMTKPFSFEELTARLRALIRRAHRVTSASIRVADLVVDTAARRASRAGRALDLRAKEYAILELLALQRGCVVTRAQILDHVYAHDSDTLSNVVDVHVCRLRSAVDRGFAAPLIHTVRGLGYVLEER